MVNDSTPESTEKGTADEDQDSGDTGSTTDYPAGNDVLTPKDHPRAEPSED